MDSHENWVEALNINPENLRAWGEQAPEGTPLLVWCLEQGHIPVETYLQWAQAQFEVPVLDSRFFSEALDPAFLREMRNATGAKWDPWLFPVDKWDDVTIVACVEVPATRADDCRYVLADPRRMREAWGPETEAFETPIGFSSAPSAKPFVLNLDESAFAPAHESTRVGVPIPKAEADEPADEPISIGAESVVVPLANLKSSPGTPPSVQELFEGLRTRFQASLVFTIGPSHAKIAYWDGRMTVSPQHKGIGLATPTFVRIVAKTAMPYHGFVMESPAHRELFQALGYPELPKCVTAIPVKRDGVVVAVVAAIGTEENQKMDSLNFAQELTDRLSADLLEQSVKAS